MVGLLILLFLAAFVWMMMDFPPFHWISKSNAKKPQYKITRYYFQDDCEVGYEYRVEKRQLFGWKAVSSYGSHERALGILNELTGKIHEYE